VCNCVKAIHTSPKCHQAFVVACDYEIIDIIIPSLDCTTCWNLMYNMLNSAIKVKQVLLKLKSWDCYFPDPLSEDEWEQEDTNILYAIACILDSSYKLEWFRYYYKQKEKLLQEETEKI
ncbi:7888_t:CDS:2, partial [Cetraspora pellucida]